MPTKSKPLLIGPSLCTLTPAQCEELARLGLEQIDLAENDGEFNEHGDEGRSLHPKFKFIFTTRDGCDEDDAIERIKYWGWESGQTEEGDWCDTHEWEIRVGELQGPMGDCWAVLPIVKWFLDHGWRWAE